MELTAEMIEARVGDRQDLVERFRGGDTMALVELLEHATGAQVASVTIRRVPRSTLPT